MSAVEDIQTRIEEIRTQVQERMQDLPIELPGIIFGNQPTESLVNRVRTKTRQMFPQVNRFTSSNLPPFNTPGLGSRLLPKSVQQLKPKTMHPGVVDTEIASIEREKGAWPTSWSISVEM